MAVVDKNQNNDKKLTNSLNYRIFNSESLQLASDQFYHIYSASLPEQKPLETNTRFGSG